MKFRQIIKLCKRKLRYIFDDKYKKRKDYYDSWLKRKNWKIFSDEVTNVMCKAIMPKVVYNKMLKRHKIKGDKKL